MKTFLVTGNFDGETQDFFGGCEDVCRAGRERE